MVVTTISAKARSKLPKDKKSRQIEAFIDQIAADYPDFSFSKGTEEHWSPKTQTIMYNPAQPIQKIRYGTLHELAHASLDHTDYKSDFELLKMEAKAWDLASLIGQKYGIKIDNDHIQNCLDTYRDWLHRRSKCPSCGTHVLQDSSASYKCFNCGESWHVSSGRFVRSYRKKVSKKI